MVHIRSFISARKPNCAKKFRIQIHILFGLKILTKYEYEYYLVWNNRPNTNTNIIRLEKITQIWMRILVCGLNYSNTELFAHLCQSWDSSWHHSWGPSYECYSVWWKKRPNTNIIRFEKSHRIRIRILFGLKKSPEYEYEY